MIIRPMLGEWEIPSIEGIYSIEDRKIVHLSVPGLDGDLQQDLGARAHRVEIVGSLATDEARDDFLNKVQTAFQEGEPLSFVADITAATRLEQVLIEGLEVGEVNESDRSFRYRVVLSQYVEPPEPEASLDGLGGPELDAELDELADLGLDGLELPDLLLDVPDLADPIEPVRPAMEGVRNATEGITGLLDGLKDALGVSG
jgi:hypothetical protein